MAASESQRLMLKGTVALADRCVCQGAMTEAISRSADGRELVEDQAEPVADGDVGGDVVVAAAQILHERVTGGQDPRGAVTFQAAHRPQPGL